VKEEFGATFRLTREQDYGSPLLQAGFVAITAEEEVKLVEKVAQLPREPEMTFLHDRGWVGPTKPSPVRALGVFNKKTGQLIKLADIGLAWNFEHAATADEVFDLCVFWDLLDKNKIERRSRVQMAQLQPVGVLPPPKVVDGVIAFGNLSFISNHGSHYDEMTITLPKSAAAGQSLTIQMLSSEE
jgi:hypothetical protein